MIKQWSKESWAGWKKKPTMTKAKADEILRANNEAVALTKAKTSLEAAKQAANRFVKKDDNYANALVEKTQKLLNKKNDKYPTLTLSKEQIQRLTEALKNTPETITAIAEFNSNVQKTERNLDALNDKHQTKITGQHKNEKTKLSELFNNNQFLEPLTEDNPDIPVEEIQIAMNKALIDYHNEQVTTFNSDTKPNQARLLEYMQRAEAKILFLSTIAKNARHQAFFDELDKKANPQEEGLSVSNDEGHDASRYADAELNDLKEFYTSSGKHVTINENGFSIKSTALGFGITEKDALQLALFAKAKGWKTIALTIEHSDPELRNKLAQNAARAALKAGFDRDAITIKVKNDKGEIEEKKVKDLLGAEVVGSLLSTGKTEPTQEFRNVTSQVRDNQNQEIHQEEDNRREQEDPSPL